ncbi:acyltransferase family protein [Acidomonas methanolica]|uniref:acyltransferase family protein n=1 Tax=Acidomonas methanolica TaxID=437 RepID=UPI0005A71173|nr:acyltransferase [Acidomonas methanolica]MBU2653046.1 acyltransferase [Acidomonas methanolica]TCS17574.1 surface polysaccharide O-acyltransferase-like enzyme [Acidomonas methanolica]
MKNKNNQAIGLLRFCLTLAVVMHHSVLTYCVFGHFNHRNYLLSTAPIVDEQRWSGFDLFVRWNDTYFMALMFLISGLFVLPSLQRKGALHYLKDRLLRLVLPFVVCVTIIMPLAYYPSILQAGAQISLLTFWHGYFGRYHWPGGPAWFIWFLFLLDALCVLTIRLFPTLPKRLAAIVPDVMDRHPAFAASSIIIAALLAYLPFTILFGPERWLSLGPFFIQGSRIGLYAFFFGLGCAVGAAGIRHSLFKQDGAPARHWLISLCLGAFSLHFFISLPFNMEGLRPVLFVFCCVSFCMAMSGLCLRHVRNIPTWMDRLISQAYGVYIIHYVFATWVQFYLLPVSWGAIPKATFVLGVTLLSSFLLTRAVRSIPFVRRVI